MDAGPNDFVEKFIYSLAGCGLRQPRDVHAERLAILEIAAACDFFTQMRSIGRARGRDESDDADARRSRDVVGIRKLLQAARGDRQSRAKQLGNGRAEMCVHDSVFQ
jgi:hypothetical protein